MFYTGKYTYGIDFIIENIGWREYIIFIFGALAIALIIAGLINQGIPRFGVLLLIITFVITMADLEYHQINFDMLYAEEFIENGEYDKAIKIYRDILDVHPGLPYVIDAYEDVYPLYEEQYMELFLKGLEENKEGEIIK